MDFFMRDGDETRLKNAQLADDMDLLTSRKHIGAWGPELVACAQRQGVHVCWYCFEAFEDRGKRQPEEVRLGHVLVLMHKGCVFKAPKSSRSFDDLVRGHQLRRAATKIVRSSGGLEQPGSTFEAARAILAGFENEGSVGGEGENGLVEETMTAETSTEEPLIVAPSGLDALSSRPDGGDNTSD